MILLAIQYHPLLTLNLLMLAVAASATGINAWMLSITVRRTLVVKRTGENGIARLEMRRAVRCEIVYFVIQVMLLAVSVYQFFKVVPLVPQMAVHFFFVAMAARMATSVLLAYLSANDLIDRRRIAVELDKLHPDTPPSEVG